MDRDDDDEILSNPHRFSIRQGKVLVRLPDGVAGLPDGEYLALPERTFLRAMSRLAGAEGALDEVNAELARRGLAMDDDGRLKKRSVVERD